MKAEGKVTKEWSGKTSRTTQKATQLILRDNKAMYFIYFDAPPLLRESVTVVTKSEVASIYKLLPFSKGNFEISLPNTLSTQ